MRSLLKLFNVALIVLLAGMLAGCQTFKDHSLTCELWQKDPTATVEASAQGKDYLYGGLARATLTPFAVAADASVVAVAFGAGWAVAAFAEACYDGAQNGGRVTY